MQKNLLIQNFPLFLKLTISEKEALTNSLEFSTVKKNTYIVKEGNKDLNLYFLLSGKIKVYKNNKAGKELTLAEFNSGNYFGEISLLTGLNRSANVIATEKSELAKLSQANFLEHSKNYHGLSSEMLKELAERLMLTTSHIADLAFLDLSAHLYKLLSNLSTKVVLDEQDVFLVRECPSHQELAAKLNSSREAVTRALAKLEMDGFIVRNEKQIIMQLM